MFLWKEHLFKGCGACATIKLPVQVLVHHLKTHSHILPLINVSWYCCLSPYSELQLTTISLLEKTAHRIASTSESQQLLNCDWVYLIDSGGQTEFLEILPAFLQHTSVCLFVTKLSENLSERPKIEYFEDRKQVGEPMLCPFTNEQMLMHCVQTIQTQCIHSSTNQDSKLVMIGTHRDLEDQCFESREEKNQRLQSKLCPEFDKSLVFHGQWLKQLNYLSHQCKEPRVSRL